MESPRTTQNNFSSVPSPQPVASTSTPAAPTKVPNPLDWSSLTTFDPAMLNLLDDSIPQPTATEGAMQMDFGFGANTGLASNAPYTTIASNPMFMSFASTFDSLSPEPSSSSSPTNNFNNSNSMGFNFDMNSLTTWPTPSTSQDAVLDDLFAGYLTSTGTMDLSMLSQSPASVSPVAHHVTPPDMNSRSSISSSSSSPSMLGSSSVFTTPRDSPQSPQSDSGGGDSVHHGDGSGCPKTKKEFEQRAIAAGASPFAPPSLRKSSDTVLGTMISCAGSSFPKTAKSDKNIEVLSAWRSIRADPKFKVCFGSFAVMKCANVIYLQDADINELCSEFTSKARCDGTKVVLEPQGVHSILESLSKKQ